MKTELECDRIAVLRTPPVSATLGFDDARNISYPSLASSIPSLARRSLPSARAGIDDSALHTGGDSFRLVVEPEDSVLQGELAFWDRHGSIIASSGNGTRGGPRRSHRGRRGGCRRHRPPPPPAAGGCGSLPAGIDRAAGAGWERPRTMEISTRISADSGAVDRTIGGGSLSAPLSAPRRRVGFGDMRENHNGANESSEPSGWD